MRIGVCAIVAGLALVSSTAHACPPPPIVSMPMMPRTPGESDDAYFDRLAEMTLGYGYLQRPEREPGETPEAFTARLTLFEGNLSKAYARVDARHQAAYLIAREREEAARWDSAPQVLLAVAGRTRIVRRDGTEWRETQFRVAKQVRGGTRARTFALRYPAFTTSCGPFYPDFSSGTRLVVFAKPGPVTVESMIGYYDRENARNSRTKDLLGPAKP